MTIYEITFLARQELNGQQVETLTKDFEKLIADNGGKTLKTEQWGLRTLAYKINKAKKAHYVMIECEAPAPAVHEVERQMRIHDDVMRYLTLKLDAPSKGPSVMMKAHEDRYEEKEAA